MPRCPPGSYELPPTSPPPHWAQSAELLPHVCPMSRLFPVVVLRALSLLVPSRISCCQGPVRPGPAWDTWPKAQEPASGNPGPYAPPPFWSGPWNFPPIQSTWIPHVPGLVLVPLKGGPVPLPGCPGRGLLGSRKEAVYPVPTAWDKTLAGLWGSD